MDFRRIGLILSTAACVLAGYVTVNVLMERMARWVEIEQKGYLWWTEEWFQLFAPTNFVERGRGRILLCGSSESREDFLFEVFEAELPGLEAYQNSYSTSTMSTFLIVLRYIEAVYGPSAMPDKIVLGVKPWFSLEYPPVERSHIPRSINKYSPFVRVDLESDPPQFVPKGQLDSIASRYRLLTHQPRRYKAALRGVFRAIVVAIRPDLAEQYWLRFKLVPSKYHHLPPRPNKQWQIDRLLAIRPPPPSADPSGREERIRREFGMLADLAARYHIKLYVVLLPQSTWAMDEFYGETYNKYREVLRGAAGETPILDLSRFLEDEELYDLTHANLEGARRVSERVARFIRQSDEMRRTAKPESNDSHQVHGKSKNAAIRADDARVREPGDRATPR